MTRRELMERICEITREATGAALSETESLKESGLDSLALVTVIAGIEERVGFFFRDDDLDPERLTTLEALAEITEKYI